MYKDSGRRTARLNNEYSVRGEKAYARIARDLIYLGKFRETFLYFIILNLLRREILIDRAIHVTNRRGLNSPAFSHERASDAIKTNHRRRTIIEEVGAAATAPPCEPLDFLRSRRWVERRCHRRLTNTKKAQTRVFDELARVHMYVQEIRTPSFAARTSPASAIARLDVNDSDDFVNIRRQ